MTEEKKSAKKVFEKIGAWMQRSIFVSLLMILMVFGAGVALLWIPSQSDLPSLEKGSQSMQDIEVVCDFSYQNKKDATRIFQEFALEFPRYFRYDPERSEKIMNGYDLLMRDILRRNAVEEEHKTYEPRRISLCAGLGSSPFARHY